MQQLIFLCTWGSGGGGGVSKMVLKFVKWSPMDFDTIDEKT